MEMIVRIKDLDVLLDTRLAAVKNVSFNLPAGKIIGLIGPSGAGKTTLLRSIVGRQAPSRGSVEILGMPAGDARLRSMISYMTQEISVYTDLTVAENLEYFAIMLGIARKDVRSEVTRVLNDVGLQAQAGQIVGSLSGGQKQRVSLAIALIGKPRLIALDEPTVGLDPVLRKKIWELFRKLTKSGITIIISSHVMDEAERCDELVLIREGMILTHDTPAGLCKKTHTDSVEHAFLALAGDRE